MPLIRSSRQRTAQRTATQGFSAANPVPGDNPNLGNDGFIMGGQPAEAPAQFGRADSPWDNQFESRAGKAGAGSAQTRQPSMMGAPAAGQSHNTPSMGAPVIGQSRRPAVQPAPKIVTGQATATAPTTAPTTRRPSYLPPFAGRVRPTGGGAAPRRPNQMTPR